MTNRKLLFYEGTMSHMSGLVHGQSSNFWVLVHPMNNYSMRENGEMYGLH
jgi:hypothetical protein